MAKKAKRSPKITLPPFPNTWETSHTMSDGTTARSPRAELERDSVMLPGTIIDFEGEAEVIPARARVWRTQLPPMFRILNPAAKAAMLEYAASCEAVVASGGTSDPTGGGGGGGGRCPNTRALIAAENLRAMHAALDGGQMAVPVKNACRLRRGDGLARVSYRDLVRWVAIDGLPRSAILTKAGAAPSNEVAQDAITVAVVDMADRLAVCCGYVSRDRAI